MLHRFESEAPDRAHSSPTDGRQAHPAPDRARPRGVRAAGEPGAIRRRRDARQAVSGGTPPGSSTRCRQSSAPSASPRRTSRRRHAARAPARRHGLGGASARRAVRAGIHGYDEAFEALVARITADFLGSLMRSASAAGSRRRDGAIVGSVFLVSRVEDGREAAPAAGRTERARPRPRPAARRRMRPLSRVTPAIAASRCGRTASSPPPAGCIRKPAFTLVHHQAVHSFGQDLVDEIWELALKV